MIDELFEQSAEPGDAIPAQPSDAGRRPWWRRRSMVVGAAIVLVAGGVAGGLTALGGGPSGGATSNGSATALATVERRTLSSQDEVTGTLGYAGTYDISVPVGTPGATLAQDQAAVDQAQAKVAADEQALQGAQSQAGIQGAAQITAAQAVVDTDSAALAAARRQLQADRSLGCPAASPATVTTPVTASGSGSASGSGPDKAGAQTPTATSNTRVAPQATGPPAATTGVAQVTTTTAVTLTGSVNPHGLATTFFFRYGTTTGLGRRTPAAAAGAGSDRVDVAADVSGLSPGTTYDVALVATNSAGSTTGAVQTFQTAQSSCVVQQQVVAADTAALAVAQSNLAAAHGSAGTSVAQAQAQLAGDQAAADAAARALGAARRRATTGSASASQAQTITAVPPAGAVIGRGQQVYGLDGAPVPLLYGTTIPWRALSLGVDDGPDVAQLQRNLVALGFGDGGTAGPHFSAGTADAVKRWQASLGQPQTGEVQLGAYVVEPGPIRAVAVAARLGQPAQPGAAILQASSTDRQVVVDLDATQQSAVRAGDSVTITLPDSSTTPGVVSSVGAVATAPQDSAAAGGSGSSGSSGSAATPTITVTITPTRPAATGRLDQAPVTVAIKTATVHNALVVPVTALLALAGGGYALETVPPRGGPHQLIGVRLGLFDDADGLVQVTGSGLAAGQQVVVPAKP